VHVLHVRLHDLLVAQCRAALSHTPLCRWGITHGGSIAFVVVLTQALAQYCAALSHTRACAGVDSHTADSLRLSHCSLTHWRSIVLLSHAHLRGIALFSLSHTRTHTRAHALAQVGNHTRRIHVHRFRWVGKSSLLEGRRRLCGHDAQIAKAAGESTLHCCVRDGSVDVQHPPSHHHCHAASPTH
jgi:hypothetical protein